jgi:competence protein ComEA
VDVALVDRQVNLAATLRDGEKIRVPVRGETTVSGGNPVSGEAGGQQAAADGGVVALNHATPEALDTLPGVGPATVAKIVAAREQQPFAVIDDLLARKVVGAATLEKLRALATVGP